MTWHPLQFMVDIFDLHSELNNKCSGLIGGTIYMAIAATTIITLVPSLFHG